MINTILLTSTIDTNNCSYLKRDNIEDRKNDYMNSLKLWLTNTSYKIVFVENSNYDLTFLKEKFNDYSDRVEYISFDGNNYNRNLGKGYGEFDSMVYALNNSEILKDSKYFNKVTGRYYLNGIEEKLNNININDYNLITYKRKVDTFSLPTVWFVMKKDIFLDFFSTGIPVNDSQHIYAESVFFELVKTISDVHYLHKIGITGISGTANKKITWME